MTITEPDIKFRTPLSLVRESLANVALITEEYEKEILDLKSHLVLKGKTLEKSNVEQASWLAFYDQRRLELKSVLDYLEMHVEKEYGRLWKSYTENYSRDLTPKDKENYIKHDQKYVDAKNLYFEIQDLHAKYQMAVDAFQARGYALNNITRAKTAGVGDSYL